MSDIKGLYKPMACGTCGKHLKRKHVRDTLRYDEHEATIWMHQCPDCGTVNSIFVFDDDSKNKNWKQKSIPVKDLYDEFK